MTFQDLTLSIKNLISEYFVSSINFIATIIGVLGGISGIAAAFVIFIGKKGSKVIDRVIDDRFSILAENRELVNNAKLEIMKSKLSEEQAQRDFIREESIEEIKNVLETKLSYYNSVNENKVYVTQKQFDHEYEVIKNICEYAYNIKCSVNDVMSHIHDDYRELFDVSYGGYTKINDEFEKYYYKNKAFVCEDIGNLIEQMLKDLNVFRVFTSYYWREYPKKIVDGTLYDENLLAELKKIEKIKEEINSGTIYGYDYLVKIVRDYLKQLIIKD